MKKCTKCKEVKSLEEFYSSKTHSEGKTSYCKKCEKQYKRDKWKVLETEKEEYKKFRKGVLKNKLNLKQSRFEEESRIRMSYAASKRTSQEMLNESVIKKIYRQYKSRGYKDSLNEFKSITQRNCYYCGLPPSLICKSTIDKRCVYFTNRRGKYIYNGIDRIDNSKGYESDNIVPCCKQCNLAKKDLTIIQWDEWLNRILNFRG